MGILELIIAESAINASVGATVYKAQERANVKAALMDWKQDGEPTPIVDGLLEKWSGTPENPREKKLAESIVSGARFVVGRRAFEHIVHGLIYQNSKMRQALPFLQKLSMKGPKLPWT